MRHAIIKTQSRPPRALLGLMGSCDLGLIQFQGGVLLSILVRVATRRRIERLALPRPVMGDLKKVKIEPDRSQGARTVKPTTERPRTVTGPQPED